MRRRDGTEIGKEGCWQNKKINGIDKGTFVSHNLSRTFSNLLACTKLKINEEIIYW